jgi:hypothetical protein
MDAKILAFNVFSSCVALAIAPAIPIDGTPCGANPFARPLPNPLHWL